MDSRVLFVALIAAVVGAGCGWFIAHSDSDSDSGTNLEVTEAPGEAAEPPTEAGAEAPSLDSQSAVLQATEGKLAVETDRRAAAEAEVERLRAEVAQLQKDAEAGRLAGGKERAMGVRYPSERFRKTLEAIDWEEAGQALSRMAPLMGAYIQSQLDGKPPPPSVGDIQKYNGALVKMALTAQQQGMPGMGTNGAFTHLALTANLVVATLAQAELPLDAAQEKRLGALADELLLEDERRLAGYTEETLELEKLLGETALKDRFYAGVDALVTEEQREALHPTLLRGRVAVDLFSSGLVWAAYLKPARFPSIETLKTKLTAQLISHFELDATQHGVMEEAVAEWLGGFPSGYLDGPLDALTQKGHVALARVRIAAEAQVAFFKRLLERLPADAPAVAKIRAWSKVILPLPKT